MHSPATKLTGTHREDRARLLGQREQWTQMALWALPRDQRSTILPEGSREDWPSEAMMSPTLEIFATQLGKAQGSLIQKACFKQGLD